MSQWTHVAAVFRLDSLGPISDENIIDEYANEPVVLQYCYGE